MLGWGSCFWKRPSPLWLQEQQRQRGVGWGGLGDSPLPSPELTPPLTPSPNLNAQNNPRGPDGGMAGALLGALLLLELLGKDRGGTHARDNDTGHRTKTRGREGG